jgi:WD40 repeat protein/tRNA A-37 threonylcarbamoyl transferase component Bud32
MSDSTERENRFAEILAEMLEGDEQGMRPDDWIERYPEYAVQLRSYLANRDQLEQVAGPRAAAVDAFAPTLTPSGEPVAPSVGTRIYYFGDYELLEEIARGGMGVVFKARQRSLNRIVALKMILSGQFSSAEDIQRFRSEAEAAGTLDHPSIVPIFEVGENQGQHYFTMKYVEGGSLNQVLARNQWPIADMADLRRSAQLVADVARAVHHAHLRGILHRDIKPGNILLDSDGRPHVSDFGLAKRVESSHGVTQTGAIVGTPSYMAPEQARADKRLTAATDVYSLGAVLYELLTGQPPFQSTNALDTLAQVVNKEPTRPSSIVRQLDRDLETITLKCLSKDKTHRYATAEALAEDLERWLRGEPISARPAGKLERVVKYIKRKPVTAALAASLLALLFLILIGGPLIAMREYGLRREIEVNAQKAEKAANREIAALRNVDAAKKQVSVTEGQRDEQTVQAWMKKIEANLGQVQAIRLREQKSSPAEAIQLIKEAAGLQSPLRVLSQKMPPAEQERVQQFLDRASPALREEATRWLTESYLIKDTTFQLGPVGLRQEYNPGVIVSPAPSMPRHALSRDGKWLVRQLVEKEGADEIELIDAGSGVVQQTIVLPQDENAEPAGGVQHRFSITPAITPDNQLILAWVIRVDGPAGVRRMTLHVETRSIPAGTIIKEQAFDVEKALPVPKSVNIYPEPGPYAFNIHRPSITFSTDCTRIGLTHRPESSTYEGSCTRPALVFSLQDGTCAGFVVEDGLLPFLISPSGNLIGAVTYDFDTATNSKELHLYDVQSRTVKQSLKLPPRADAADVWTMSPDDKWLAYATGNELHVCHLPSAKWTTLGIPGATGYLPLDRQNWPGRIAFHPAGTCLIVLTENDLQCYQLPDFTLMSSQRHAAPGKVGGNPQGASLFPIDLQFCDEGRLAFCLKPSLNQGANDDATWQIWHYSLAGNSVHDSTTLESIQHLALFENSGRAVVTHVGKNFIAANRFAAIDLEHDQEARMDSGKTGEPPRLVSMPVDVWANRTEYGWTWIRSFGEDHFLGPARETDRNDFDSQGRRFFSRDSDNRGLLSIDCTNGNISRPLGGESSYLFDAKVGVEGSVESLKNDEKKAEIVIYDRETDKVITRFTIDAYSYYRFHYVAENQLFLACVDTKILVYQLPEGKLLNTIPCDLGNRDVDGIFRSIYGNRIVVVQSAEIKETIHTIQVEKNSLVDLSTGNVFHEWITDPRHSVQQRNCGSDDGKRLAWIEHRPGTSETSLECYLTLWNDTTGERPPVRLALSDGFDGRLQMGFLKNSPRLVITGEVRDERATPDPTNPTDLHSRDRVNGWRALELWDAELGTRIATSQESEGCLTNFLECLEGGGLALSFQVSRTDGDPARLEVWDATTGKIRGSFPKTKAVGTLRNGRYLVGLEQNEMIQIINVDNGQVRFTATGKLESILETGGVLATSAENELRLWHVDDQHHVVLPVAQTNRKWFGSQGSLLVSEDQRTGLLTFWDTRSGKVIQTLDLREDETLPNQPVGPGSQVQVCPTGKTVAVNCHGQVRLYDLASGRKIGTQPRSNHAGSVNAIAVSGSGQWIATGGGDRTVGIWDADTGKFAAMLDGYQSPLANVAFSKDGGLITRDQSGLLAYWQILPASENQVKPQFVWQRTGSPQAKEHNALVICQDRVACGTDQGMVNLYRLADGQETGQVRVAPENVSVTSLAFHEKSQTIAVTCSDNQVHLLDATNDRVKSTWKTNQNDLSEVAFDPLNDRLFTLGQDICYWECPSQRLLQRFHSFGKSPYTLNISKEGRWLIATGGDSIRRIDLRGLDDQLRKLGLQWE